MTDDQLARAPFTDVVEAALDILSLRHRMAREDAEDLLIRSGDARDTPIEEVAEDVVLIGLPASDAAFDVHGSPPVTRAGQSPAGDLLAALATAPQEVGREIVREAVKVIPGAVAACLTIQTDGAKREHISTGPTAAVVDQRQYRSRTSPLRTGLSENRWVLDRELADARHDQAWYRAARTAGYTFVLAVPLPIAPRPSVLTIYGTTPGPVPDPDPATLEELARSAGEALLVAQRMSPAQ
jgi:hypothetical protein